MAHRGVLGFTFEYDGRGKDPGFVECQVHYSYTPGAPDCVSGPADNWSQGYGHEVEYDYAEREVTDAGGVKHWTRLHQGEFLDEQCLNYLHTREECDLIEGLPNGGERDPDDARDDMIERRRMDAEMPSNWGGDC